MLAASIINPTITTIASTFAISVVLSSMIIPPQKKFMVNAPRFPAVTAEAGQKLMRGQTLANYPDIYQGNLVKYWPFILYA